MSCRRLIEWLPENQDNDFRLLEIDMDRTEMADAPNKGSNLKSQIQSWLGKTGWTDERVWLQGGPSAWPSAQDAQANREVHTAKHQTQRFQNMKDALSIDDNVVLCTRSKTYSVRFLETSNSLLLLERAESPANHETDDLLPKQMVRATLQGHLECRSTAPCFSALRSLLYDRARYSKGMEKGILWRDLLDVVQASENQLQDHLLLMDIVRLNDSDTYCVIDSNEVVMALETLLDTILVEGWSAQAIDRDGLLKRVIEQDHMDAFVAQHVLNKFFVLNDAVGPTTALVRLRVSWVVRALVDSFLKGCSNETCALDEVIRQVQYRLPEDALPSDFDFIDHLRGVAIWDEPLLNTHALNDPKGNTHAFGSEWTESSFYSSHNDRDSQHSTTVLHRLLADELPLNAATRLDTLFRIRKEWTREEIDPYLDGITDNELFRYARALQASVGGQNALVRLIQR